MTPYFADDWLTVYQGDCREVMASMEPASVHCVVTSPPYWGLRDYGTASWVGGGWECGGQHDPIKADPDWWRKSSDDIRAEIEAEIVPPDVLSGAACPICEAPRCDHMEKVGGTASSTLGVASGGHALSDAARVRSTERSFVPYKGRCGKCGAIREDNQLGLEPTPEEYVANMVGVFREVRRVLRDDGTVWLNLGDSYAQSAGRKDADDGREAEFRRRGEANGYAPGSNFANYGKRMGEARSTVVSGLKPKDLVGIPWRVAFALQADGWYLRSDIIWSKPNPMPESVTDRPTKSHEYLFLLSKSARYYFDAEAVREDQSEASIASYERAKASPREAGTYKQNAAVAHIGAGDTVSPNAAWSDPEKLDRLLSRGRNIRSVWTIATQPYPGAHFATFPPKLVEPCVKAGCPQQGVVLDPFGGSGTTGMVAQHLGRRAVLIDLNGDYLVQAMRRNQQAPLGLGDTDAA